jgi:hypothetical protein
MIDLFVVAIAAYALYVCSRGGATAPAGGGAWPGVTPGGAPPPAGDKIPPLPGKVPPIPHETPTSSPASAPAKKTTTWPTAVPPGLPPFPGQGWEYDNPPPPEVVARAWELLPKLQMGQSKVEMTGGRWIAYRKEPHAGGKKGVTAYRLKKGLVTA